MTPTIFTRFCFLVNSFHELIRTCILDLKAVAMSRRTFELRAVASAHFAITVRIQRPVFRKVIANIFLQASVNACSPAITLQPNDDNKMLFVLQVCMRTVQ